MDDYVDEDIQALKRFDLSHQLLTAFFGMMPAQQEAIVKIAQELATIQPIYEEERCRLYVRLFQMLDRLSMDQMQRVINLCRALTQEVEQ